MLSYGGQAVAALVFSVLAFTAFAGSQRAYAYTPAANFLDALEYKVELDADQLMSKQAKADLAKSQPRDFAIDKIKREIVGFQVSATDVKIHMTPSRIDADRTRISIDIEGKNVAVDSGYFHKKFSRLDVETIYGVYNARTDKVTVHIPFATAFSLAFR